MLRKETNGLEYCMVWTCTLKMRGCSHLSCNHSWRSSCFISVEILDLLLKIEMRIFKAFLHSIIVKLRKTDDRVILELWVHLVFIYPFLWLFHKVLFFNIHWLFKIILLCIFHCFILFFFLSGKGTRKSIFSFEY